MNLFLQAASPLGGIMPLILMMGAMLIFITFQNNRKRKKVAAFQDSLKKGDEVVTMSGVLGRVDKVEDQIVTLNVGNKTYLRVTKNSISQELTNAIYPPKAAE